MTTSFRNIFRDGLVTRIEIPIIQRDYAQGRKDVGVTRIRTAFLRVLRYALVNNKAVALDFVYGEIENGQMIPLDGQQRLTTLFLLHWYLAVRGGIAADESAFLGMFTYRTRFSARHFCEKLVSERPPFSPPSVETHSYRSYLSNWLTDQHWYAGAWKHDPTIQSMLVALDDIHNLFAADDKAACRVAWNRLVAQDNPAITFDFLSIKDLGLSDDLYIKMNSRGKPLTLFEHFKADFEKTLGEMSKDARTKFAHKVDRDWSDLLWPLRDNGTNQGDDAIIDDEFLRLFHFIGDIIIQRQGLAVDAGLFDADTGLWAERIYGTANPMAADARQYMFDAFDSLVNEFRTREVKKVGDFTSWFGCYFSEKGYSQGRVVIYDKVDLFGDCCAKYGEVSGQLRAFPLARTLLLFAFLQYLMHPTPVSPEKAAQRLRTVRNLIFASDNEIRPSNLPALLNETAEYIHSGDLSTISTYNARQIEEEKSKNNFLRQHADCLGLREALHRLEDHPLLRGCLAAFDLPPDAATFIQRAKLFHEVFPESCNPSAQTICAALLACGEYQQRTRNGRFQFGSPKSSQLETWRNLLTNASIDHTKAALLQMLDDFGQACGSSAKERLQAVANDYLVKQERAGKLDWRYYLVKYPSMRSGDSGLYVSAKGSMGFDLCMLHKTQLNSNYRDPYLLAVIDASDAREGYDVAENWHYGWDGYRQEQRWIELSRSGEKVISCREDGFQLLAPEDVAELAIFNAVCSKHEINSDLVLRVPQLLKEDETYDLRDRIEAAASLLKDLITGFAASVPDSFLLSDNIGSSPLLAGSTDTSHL